MNFIEMKKKLLQILLFSTISENFKKIYSAISGKYCGQKGGKNNCKKVRNKERKNTAIVIRSSVGNGRLKFKTTQTL